MKNEKGITLISLAITIIVMLIIVGAATYSGMETIDRSKRVEFISEMEIIQSKVNNIYEKRKLSQEDKEYYDNLGQDISNVSEEKLKTALGEKSEEGFLYFNSENLKELGLDNINQEIIINYNTREVISLTGITLDGKKYYKLEDIPGYTTNNVEYVNKNREAPSFNVETTKISENEYRVRVKDIVYNSNVKGGTIKYKLHSETNWILNGEDTTLTVTIPGLYDICFTDKAGNETVTQELVREFDYTQKGLLVYYDGKNNVDNNKHDELATVWKDLTGNGNDGELKNFNNTTESKWTDNSLIFDGIDDFVTIKNLDLSKYNDITICATYKILSSIPNNKVPGLVCSNSSKSGRLFFGYSNYEQKPNTYTINYTNPDKWIYAQANSVEMGKIKNITATYMGQDNTKSNKIYCNNKLIATDNTVMISKWGSYNLDIGRSFGAAYINDHPYAKVELYNLLIYEGTLEENEIQNNYQIDEERFNIK